MTNKLIRAGSSYTTPEIPYQPGRPAYTSYETVTVVVPTPPPIIGNGLAPGWVYKQVATTLPDGTVVYRMQPVWTGLGVGGGGSNVVQGPGDSYTYTYTVATYHPAVPAIPGSPSSRVDIPPVGWTSSARSIASIHQAGTATFKVPTAVAGAAVGFSYVNSPRPRRPGYSDLHKGLFFSAGVVKLLLDGTPLGSYTGADTFKIDIKQNGDTRWYRNAELIFSATEAAVAPGQVGVAGGATLARSNLVAVLYASGDYIDEPTLGESLEGRSTATAPAMSAFSGNMQGGTSIARAPAMRAESRADLPNYAVAPAARAVSGNLAGGTSTARAPAMRADSYGGTIEVILPSNSIAQAPAQAAASVGVIHVLGTSTAEAPAARALSFQQHGGQSIARAPAARALSYTEDPGTALIVVGLALDIGIRVRQVERIVLLESLALDIGIDVRRVDQVRIEEALGLQINIGERIVDTVRIPFVMALDIEVSAPGDDIEVWAVNLDGYGSTSYTGYPFNSMARIGDRYFGAKPDGIFLLDGNTDAGAPIRAAISPGKLDFGSAAKKVVSEVFVGLASDAPLHLSLAADGEVYDYASEAFSQNMQTQRIKLGKGLQANYITPTFRNADGADFELDELELTVATLTRKT